jgi:uncharacterized protein (DUF2252 family)
MRRSQPTCWQLKAKRSRLQRPATKTFSEPRHMIFERQRRPPNRMQVMRRWPKEDQQKRGDGNNVRDRYNLRALARGELNASHSSRQPRSVEAV